MKRWVILFFHIAQGPCGSPALLFSLFLGTSCPSVLHPCSSVYHVTWHFLPHVLSVSTSFWYADASFNLSHLYAVGFAFTWPVAFSLPTLSSLVGISLVLFSTSVVSAPAFSQEFWALSQHWLHIVDLWFLCASNWYLLNETNLCIPLLIISLGDV